MVDKSNKQPELICIVQMVDKSNNKKKVTELICALQS